ncbi:flagellar hook-basal body complex protein, partial [Rossellomorea vietnamensis]|uniref:flagellar hook-basal body complex protein n=1 Tax=Rossellomorea vietnamensis TaxID=218284 RepID=UPI00308A0C24
MLRSMYSGISGMKNFQTKLDVIGNNIANVNTFGFKKGRVTFQDIVSQQISGASAASANKGGINPKQVGLGSQISSIDTIDTQGSLQ